MGDYCGKSAAFAGRRLLGPPHSDASTLLAGRVRIHGAVYVGVIWYSLCSVRREREVVMYAGHGMAL